MCCRDITRPASQLFRVARLYYRGPLQRTQNYASIIFDITNDETVVAEPVARTVFHPYSDGLPADVAVQYYSLEELLSEKTRALYQRTRPRDLYDVVYLLENCIDAIDLRFKRQQYNAQLKPHKDKTGWDCPGRIGYWVDTIY